MRAPFLFSQARGEKPGVAQPSQTVYAQRTPRHRRAKRHFVNKSHGFFLCSNWLWSSKQERNAFGKEGTARKGGRGMPRHRHARNDAQTQAFFPRPFSFRFAGGVHVQKATFICHFCSRVWFPSFWGENRHLRTAHAIRMLGIAYTRVLQLLGSPPFCLLPPVLAFPRSRGTTIQKARVEPCLCARIGERAKCFLRRQVQ